MPHVPHNSMLKYDLWNCNHHSHVVRKRTKNEKKERNMNEIRFSLKFSVLTTHHIEMSVLNRMNVVDSARCWRKWEKVEWKISRVSRFYCFAIVKPTTNAVNFCRLHWQKMRDARWPKRGWIFFLLRVCPFRWKLIIIDSFSRGKTERWKFLVIVIVCVDFLDEFQKFFNISEIIKVIFLMNLIRICSWKYFSLLLNQM